jgi:hypothetical protein
VFELLGYFLALGALILYFAATALGRLSVRSVRDIELEERTAAAEVDAGGAPAPTSGRFRRRSRLAPRDRGATTSRRNSPVDDG